MARVTIADIARRAGVSTGAVSYALNGRPGVSEATRERVLEVARQLDWHPHSAARSLSGARTRTVGLVVTRPAETLGTESFFIQFVSGLESVLGPSGHGLLLQVVPAAAAEEDTLRTWARERRVDGVVLLDPRVDDPRVPLVRELRMPSVVVGHPSVAGGLPSVWKDDAAAVAAAVDHLVGLGHTRVGRVAGPERLGHTVVRDDAFRDALAASGATGVVRHTDFTGPRAAEATLALAGPDAGAGAPTALLYDNDVMAVAGLSALAGAGRSVPDDVSLVAWDDSPLCHVTHPALTAVGHDLVGYGAAVADLLVRQVRDGDTGPVEVPAPTLRLRASTAPPPGARRRAARSPARAG
ncbi:LacI family DNA-binding transcriptional regulator [Pseudokineococcus lusitanus]|uniref:LacI family transcriptional regulator n=1 Tax=Pseudokineococcus lusitanus TaxID=763993 RepID=A0A3N1G9X3_9ACTN|nr:LacI family DNA-binding transcriptional regulator [Pseudokineococcus lusitanus]ROP27032.1 LacI family transcriptional regulator [Pseudokineococcus lusitanus]